MTNELVTNAPTVDGPTKVSQVLLIPDVRRKIWEIARTGQPEHSFEVPDERGSIEALVVLRHVDQDQPFFPTREDLERYKQILQGSNEATLVEGRFIKGDPIVKFLFMKRRFDHNIQTHGRLNEDIERLARVLPKRKDQKQILVDIAGCRFIVTTYDVPSETLAVTSEKLRKDYKFA